MTVVAPFNSKINKVLFIFYKVWLRARDQLRDTLEGATFDQLAKEGSCVPILPVFEEAGN